MESASLVCARCGRGDMVEKVGDLYADQTRSLRRGRATARSLLARQLAPPSRRARAVDAGCVAVAAALIVGFFLLMAAIGVRAAQSKVWTLLWALLGVGLLYWYCRQRAIGRRGELGRSETASTSWEAGVRVWDRLCYCGRDDTAFDPQRRRWMAVDAIQDYVYSEEAGWAFEPVPGRGAPGVG